jgi:hypothetical protein
MTALVLFVAACCGICAVLVVLVGYEWLRKRKWWES